MHGSRFRFQVPIPVSLYRCIAVSLFSSSLSERLQDLRVNLITRGYTNNIIDNAFNKALQYTQSNLLIDENQENMNKTVRIDDNSTNQCPTNEPNSNKPILTFSVPYNTNTTHIGSILRKYTGILLTKTHH